MPNLAKKNKKRERECPAACQTLNLHIPAFVQPHFFKGTQISSVSSLFGFNWFLFF